LTLTLIQLASKWKHWATPPTPFRSVMSCHLCFRPGDSHPYQVLVDCAPPVCTRTTWTSLKPQNLPVQRLSRYALVIHSYHISKPVESSFTEYVIHTAALSSSESNLFFVIGLLCPSRKCPRFSFAICEEQRSVFSLPYQVVFSFYDVV